MTKIYWNGKLPEPRKFFNSVVLPACIKYKPILFPGIAGYTKDYKKLMGNDFITVDILSQRDGVVPDICCDITSTDLLQKCKSKFKCIIFNGLLGYGINNKNQFDKSLNNFTNLIEDGGLLFIGYNETMFKNRKLILDCLSAFDFKVSSIFTNKNWNVGGRVYVIIICYYKNIRNTIEHDIEKAIKNKYAK